MVDQCMFVSANAVEALEKNTEMVEIIESLTTSMCEALCRHARSSRLYVSRERMESIISECLQDCINKMYGLSGTSSDQKQTVSDQEKKFFDSMRKEIFKFYKSDLLKEYDTDIVESSLDYFLKSRPKNWVYLSYKNGLREMCEMAKHQLGKN
jgi:hypothetical protein